MNTKVSLICSLYRNYLSKLFVAQSDRNGLSFLTTINNATRYFTQESQDQSYYNVSYEEMKEITRDKSKKVLLIDVREPEELSETGVLPSSINIPCKYWGSVEDALKNMSNKDFLKVYGREKPDKNFPIIFSCKLGKRSATACGISQQLGFKNVKNYLGGWQEWEERNQNK
ncbi:hypothetical protein NQ315_002525 [Exocentrus adspersus]|uniref:Rhodanese domain-containing protein n=1 Tax=Exocentrus adspersus TaxID=1586481 RepID=A0AAV8VLF9_9CUCU|nr:hypothetical protein NQ315_002525 [Exocentrus adspersus]